MRLKPVVTVVGVVASVFVLFVIMILAAGRFVSPSSALLATQKVAVVELIGPILDSKPTVDRLIEFRRDDAVRAIVLRIDSPGGGVGPSQEIHDELARTVMVKPVVASMGAVAASGGYYVAAPCNRIYANPGTITGSIGVIMEFADLRKLFDKIGLATRVVKSGEHKDMGSPLRDMTPKERALLQGVIDDAYDQFVQAVAEGRKLEVEAVRQVADGRIFTGRQALGLQLVDEMGGLQDAIREAAALGGISGEPKVVYPKEDKPGLIDLLLENTFSMVEQRLKQSLVPDGLHYLWPGDEQGRLK